MKVTVNEKEQKEITYPCLMKHQDRGLIVLFISDRAGIRLKSDGTYDKTVKYLDTWNVEAFQPFHGTVTLQND